MARTKLNVPPSTLLAVDKKPISRWWQKTPGAMNISVDVSDPQACAFVCQNATHVYQLAAEMGGMGFIERNRVTCMRNVLINANMLEAAYQAGVQEYFYASSACAYPVFAQQTAGVQLKEHMAYPAKPERGYGWEKLFSEQLAQEYVAECAMQIWIARFHNVYGPHGSWNDGREKAPAALCRKVVHAIRNDHAAMTVWGDGMQERSFMYISDCIEGIHQIMRQPSLIGEPINLGSDQAIVIKRLAELAMQIGETELVIQYDKLQPTGVGARNSDNTMIRDHTAWAPSIKIEDGLRKLYYWIEKQYDQYAVMTEE